MVNVLVVLSDLEETAKKLIETAVAIAKPGDRVQLVYVTKHAELLKEAAAMGAKEPTFPGQDADKSRAVEETVAAKELQQELAAKWGPTLDAVQVPYQVHIVPTNVLHLAAHIVELAGVESAALLMLPKAANAFVAGYVMERCPQPLVLV